MIHRIWQHFSIAVVKLHFTILFIQVVPFLQLIDPIKRVSPNKCINR